MNSGEAGSFIVKAQFGGYGNHVSWHLQKFGNLDSVEYWEYKLLLLF
jgi:hypothetical protein